MERDELREALEDAGLSQYQADAYTTLLRLGAASATEVADSCDVPSARIYDVLRDLETKGYIETYEQGSLHARASNPKQVLSELENRATLLSEAADEIEERWNQPAVSQTKLSIVKRFETVFSRAEELIREVENEVQLAVTPSGFEELKPALQTAHENGAVIKISIHTEGTEAGTVPPESTFDGVATEVRHQKLPAPFVAIIDRNWTCFAPHRQSLNQYGVLVDDRTLTYVFHWYFLTCLWEVWDPIYTARAADPPMVYADIRRCIRDIEPLLDAGVTLHADIVGYETTSGAAVSLSGTITDALYAGTPTTDGTVPLTQLAGQVSLFFETDDDTYTVGGWGAVLEDIEATRLTITKITAPVDL